MRWTKSLAVIAALALAVSSAIGQPAKRRAPESLKEKEIRVVVIANTDAEADELMAVLNSRDVRPPTLGAPKSPEQCQPGSPPDGLRGCYEGENGVKVEFWCVWDLQGRNRQSDDTPDKVNLLPNKVRQPPPAMVIAFGTGAGHWQTSYNGSVVVGSAVFLHSFSKNDDLKALEREVPLDTIIESTKGSEFLSDKKVTDFIEEKRDEIQAKFLKPPLNPAGEPLLLIWRNRLGLSSINVFRTKDYARADTDTLCKALEAMRRNPEKFAVGGVETTHGIIRAFTPENAPFIYVTGITNRLGHFSDELMPRRAAQHVAVVNNAGVVAAYLIDFILRNPGLLPRSP